MGGIQSCFESTKILFDPVPVEGNYDGWEEDTLRHFLPPRPLTSRFVPLLVLNPGDAIDPDSVLYLI